MAMDPKTIRHRIEHADDLPTLSVVANQITRLANNPSTSAADIGRLIESDQALTANVLRLVNSSYYSFPQKIRSIQHAVVILGFSKVKNVVLTASVIDSARGAKDTAMDLRRLWQHAMGTAVASKVVADLIGAGAQADDAFIAGLLHDIGKFILAVMAPEEYGAVVASSHTRLIYHAEREKLGFTHADAGLWLAQRWRLPAPIQGVIQDHHAPNATQPHQSLNAAVHIGDIITRALGVGSGGDFRIPAFSPDAIAQYRLDARFLDRAIQRVMNDLDRAHDFFDLLDGQREPE